MTVVENETSMEQSNTNQSYNENTLEKRISEVSAKQTFASDIKEKGEYIIESGIKATTIIEEQDNG